MKRQLVTPTSRNKVVSRCWCSGSAVPPNGNETVSAILTTSKSELKEPLWVDTITGGIYELPMERMLVEGEKLFSKDVLVYDAPTLIADKSLLMPWAKVI